MLIKLKTIDVGSKLNKVILAALWLLCASSVFSAEENFTLIAYPIEKNLVREEGTVELWIRPDRDLTQELAPKEFYYFNLFRFSYGKRLWGETGNFSLSWNRNGLYTGGTMKGEPKLRNFPLMFWHSNHYKHAVKNKSKEIWEKGSWNHVALTWKLNEISIYSNGKLVAKKKISGDFPFLREGFIIIGYAKSRIAVDEFIVSSICRSPEEIKKRSSTRTEKDEYCLIFDQMENLGKVSGRLKEVNPQKASLVKGKYGKAIQLHKK